MVIEPYHLFFIQKTNNQYKKDKKLMITYSTVQLSAPEDIDAGSMKFPAGEVHLKNTTANVATWYAEPDTLHDELTELVMWGASRYRKLQETYLIMPYLPGARADRGNPFGAKVYADIINTGMFTEVFTFDPHSPVMPSLIHNLNPYQPDPLQEIMAKEQYTGIIAPDKGAVERAEKVANTYNLPCYHATKTRDFETGKLTAFNAPHNLPREGKFLVVDDICDGGGTFAGLAEVLNVPKENLHLYVSHGVFSKQAPVTLQEHYGKIYTTGSYLSKNIERFKDLTLLPIMESYMEHIKQSIKGRVGMVKDTETTCAYLSNEQVTVTPEDLDRMVNNHELLRIADGNKRDAYPSFQFANGAVHPNMKKLLHLLLGAGMEPWTVTFWLTQNILLIGDRRPVDVLDDNEDFSIALAIASSDAGDLKANS